MIVTVTLNPSLDEWVELPELRVGRLNRATTFRRYPGGKGINVSRVVLELGGRTVALGLAGGDDGDMLSRELELRGVSHEFVLVEGATRNNYQLLTSKPRGLTQINAPGPRASKAVLTRLGALIRRRAAKAKAVVISGSLPPGAPASTYRHLLDGLKSSRTLSVLDSSGAAFKQGLRSRPWLIKPNADEAAELLGTRLDRLPQQVKAARAMATMGPTLVMLSMGRDGALLAASGQETVWHARPPKVRMGSAVGAGDSLVAGFVTGWLRSRSLEAALRLGIACGAGAAMTSGTELCRRVDVVRLMPKVSLRKV